jgi:hypothetical protein
MTGRIPLSAFGGDTRYPNDLAFVAYIINQEWDLGVEEHVGYVYHDERGLVRDNGPDGRGSIYIYDIGFTEAPIQGTNYESIKRQHSIGISIMNRDEERHKRWVNEVLDILDYYRRAGTSQNLNGWSYIDFSSEKKVGGYTDYYDTDVELKLMKTVHRLKHDGNARISRRDYLKQQRDKDKKKK